MDFNQRTSGLQMYTCDVIRRNETINKRNFVKKKENILNISFLVSALPSILVIRFKLTCSSAIDLASCSESTIVNVNSSWAERDSLKNTMHI